MPFIRYSRDKRGYESTVVLHAYRGANGPPRTRVLYLFRSPSHAKVGRRPLDAEVMEALEHTHPDLTFDWSGLTRVATVAPRFEARGRYERPANRAGRSQSRPQAPAPPPIPVIIEDDSALGRVLGGPEALRLRSRYSELLQRIARRARSPEERDRLMERAVRLNPDEWPDEAVTRAAASTFDADCEAVAVELPQRRRGRRGGRPRSQEGHDYEKHAQNPGDDAPGDGGGGRADAGEASAGSDADPGGAGSDADFPDAG